MLKNIIVGLLVLTVIGASIFSLIDNQNTNSTEPTAAITQPVQASTDNVGEVWSAKGTILDLGTVGMSLALEDNSEVYVELGPETYWQTQDITLNTGSVVTVDGFFNGENYHARTVTTSNGEVLALRSEAGQPLWSGSNSNGGQGGTQIPVDQWVTVEGTVTALSNNGVILQTADAQTLTISFGRVDFWQTQNITFAVADAISMLGFWQDGQFQVGQVTKTATGERILLRDPNGRPLWAGPGRGQGNGQGQHTTPEATANS